MSKSFIDPNTLSIPGSPEPGPSRKRPRSEMSAEERKEASAHRNRIAAQHSRDRRKAQFSYLERRVAELEEENRQLKAGLGLNKDRENEELRERIKTLEQGWDAVVKALAAQGLSTGVLPAQKPAEERPASPSPQETQQQQLTMFPLSPAPSNTSLEFDLSPELAPFIASDDTAAESTVTRHLARVATIESPSMSLQRVTLNSSFPIRRKQQILSITLPPSTIQQWRTCSGKSSSLPLHPRHPFYHLLLTCRRRRRRRPQPPRRK